MESCKYHLHHYILTAEHLKKVHFNEEVQVKTVETAPEDVEIDEVIAIGFISS